MPPMAPPQMIFLPVLPHFEGIKPTSAAPQINAPAIEVLLMACDKIKVWLYFETVGKGL